MLVAQKSQGFKPSKLIAVANQAQLAGDWGCVVGLCSTEYPRNSGRLRLCCLHRPPYWLPHWWPCWSVAPLFNRSTQYSSQKVPSAFCLLRQDHRLHFDCFPGLLYTGCGTYRHSINVCWRWMRYEEGQRQAFLPKSRKESFWEARVLSTDVTD